MEKFLKRNWFKEGLLFLILLFVLSVAYYFIFYLPMTRKAQVLLGNQAHCLALEDKQLAGYKQYETNLTGKNPNFAFASNHYNKKLGTCMVEISDILTPPGPMGYDSSTRLVQIVDAVEDVNMASCIVAVGKNAPPTYCYTNPGITGDTSQKITKEQFDVLEKQYMTE